MRFVPERGPVASTPSKTLSGQEKRSRFEEGLLADVECPWKRGTRILYLPVTQEARLKESIDAPTSFLGFQVGFEAIFLNCQSRLAHDSLIVRKIVM